MPHISADRVQETTTTTGTGALTLAGAVANFKTFASRMAVSDTCWYAIVDGNNTAWETGLGTYSFPSSVPTLTRTTILKSSNADAVVTLAAGTKNVFITLPGDKSPIFDSVNALSIPAITTEPATPAASTLLLYSKLYAGRMVPKTKGPSGLDTPLQNAFWQNSIVMWNPSSATAGVWFGSVGTATSSGTFAVGLPTNTSLYTVQQRGRYANVITTVNQVLGVRQSSNPTYFLGNVASQGGFFFFCRMGFDTWTNGSRMFVGLSVNTAGLTVSGDPSAVANSVGFCIDVADNGLISFLMRGAAATKTSTGFTAVSGKGYDLYMFAAPNSTTVNYRIVDTNAGTEASGAVSVNPPAVNTTMVPQVLASNAALTPVTSVNMGINRLYLEPDY